MPLTAGEKLGPYEILGLLGAGGMGEVYRACDTRLNRNVAIKLSAAQFTERFDREARAVAALNHPNICHLYDVGTNYLVMELVEGETLKGPLPFDEALPVAMQIVDALEAAHEKGILHRDLKPANIMITTAGVVKVLDFGLAKALEPEPGGNPETSPTLSLRATQVGMILGTAAYMAPEQARGKSVDRRADIWAFGAVLYEMLTGRPAFSGETVTDILASVVKSEPDWNGVRPEALRLLRHCLEKDPKKRLQAIGDARLFLDAAPVAETAVPAGPAAGSSRWVGWAVAAIAALGLAALALVHFRELPPADFTLRLSVPLPPDSLVASFALSPDGHRMALALIYEGKRNLWIRELDSERLQLLSGTASAQYPFWSPDGRSIGFFADGKLKTIPAGGGPSQTLCDSTGGGGTWNRNGVILFSTGRSPILQVPSSGGTCTAITKPEGPSYHSFPVFLPDGIHFLYQADGGGETSRGVYLAALDKPLGSRRILPDQSSVVFASSAPGKKGYLLFIRETTLMAQPFDADVLQPAGDLFPVATHASFSTTGTQHQVAASAAANGVLVFLANRTLDSKLAWVDRSGKEFQIVIPQGVQRTVALSPKGTSAVSGGPNGLLLLDLIRNTPTRFTFPPVTGAAPVWSADGTRIVFSEDHTLYVKDAAGVDKEQILLQKGPDRFASDWSRDGRFLLFTQLDDKALGDLWVLPEPLANGSKPFPFLSTEFNEGQGQFSPDTHWIAYVSNESGQEEVWVRPFPPGSGQWKRKVSKNKGTEPRWRRDGKELFYKEGAARGRWIAVPVVSGRGGMFEPGETRPLFEFVVKASPIQFNAFTYGVSEDGQRFLINHELEGPQETLNVITNWQKAAASGAREP